MKLYIRFGSLCKFQQLYDSNKYLQAVLGQTRSNVYLVADDADINEIERLLKSRRINYALKE